MWTARRALSQTAIPLSVPIVTWNGLSRKNIVLREQEREAVCNTANIGSITGMSVSDFASDAGPFSTAGEEVFLDYWRNYGRTAAERPYSNLEEYYQWKQRTTI